MNFQEIQALDRGAVMPTYGRFAVALDHGKGAVATDTQGKEYIDFGSGIGVNSLGFAYPAWVKAVSEQAATLQHTSNLYYNPVQAQFADELCRAAGMSRAFLCNSGAEANECAIKLARKYSFDHYGEGRATIVTLVNSFHGRTVTTLAATGQDGFHRYFDPFTGGFRYAEAGDIGALEEALDSTVCAVLLECVQGEGGVIALEPAYLQGGCRAVRGTRCAADDRRGADRGRPHRQISGHRACRGKAGCGHAGKRPRRADCRSAPACAAKS